MTAPEILIVDDDEFTVRLTRRVIGLAGLDGALRTAVDGLDAIEQLQGGLRPDVILLDINMPRMNGFEFLDAYDALPMATHDGVSIVMVTTSGRELDRTRAMANPHVRAYVEKPFTREWATWLRDEVLAEDGTDPQ